MCTRHFGMCVHSSDGVSERDGEKNEIYLFFLSLFLSLVPTEKKQREREREKFEILSHRRTHARTACCSLAYILALDSGASYMKFQNRRVKHDEEEKERQTRERRWTTV